jgi:hypothetical protein
MATRSRIAIENQDGTVTSIYCHFDGYLEHNGKILQNYFTNREKVEQLIALGDLSCLGEDIEEGSPDTIAYARDRGEDFHQKQHKDVEAFFSGGEIERIGYCFVKGDKWLVSTGGPVSNLFLALEGEDVL